ncbi:MAG TPA: tyrosine-type recombinase/integrase, partial [Aeromicrobium sp.]|nr:tyrosine-type recombinase/integrase [Aeromicrobium sp.]
LLSVKVNQEGFNPIDAVFPTRRGTWHSRANVHRQFRDFRTWAKLDENVTWRAFRKAVATLLANEVGVEVAQAQLGHADAKTTRQHYAARPSVAPDSSDILDGHFG